MNIIQRITSPTPPFFKKLRTIGLILAGLSATIIAAPAALPVVVLKAAGYLAVAGGVATAVSQAATVTEEPKEEDNEQHGD